MANVSLCTVCVMLIVLHKPEALSLHIDRSLCLETIIKFMHDQQKCRFNYMHADGFLKDGNVTCQTKCQVTINNINSNGNGLEKVVLGFGYEIPVYEYEPCRWQYITHSLNMNITCPVWNKVKVPIGGYCKQDEQCLGNKNSGVCEHDRCVCKTGYILSNLECYEGYLDLNQPCSFNEQCSRSTFTSCLEGKCSCIEGYTAEGSDHCVQIKVTVGGHCKQNEQCLGSENSGVCDHGTCVCRTGYVLFNLECHEGNLALNQPCSFSEQCSGSPYTSCLERKCSCIKGYTAEESTYCVQIKVPVGGYCALNEQCQGNENSGVCDHGRCVCRAGYILFNLECYEGNFTLNQSCSFSEQCSGSPHASCLGGICSCIVGYTAENATDCVQETVALNQSCTSSDQCAGSPYASCFGGKCTCIKGYTAENSAKCFQSQEITLASSSQHHQDEAKIGTILGALFGGLLLGVVLTTVAVRIFYRRSKTHINKREEPNVAFADNNRYSLAKIVDHGTFQNIKTKNEEREISPYACSKETWIYDNVYSKPRNRQTQEAVYNHLHEYVKQDDDDYYDHACAASAHIGDMEDYSHVQHTSS